jgi:WD40 repeat protein
MQLEREIDLPVKTDCFVTCVAYDEKSMIYGFTCTDKKVYFYQKGKIRIEFLKSIDTPVIENKIFYLQKQGFWITSGRDHKIRQWDIARQGSIIQEYQVHSDDVTQIVEILNPKCIASASLD